MNNEASCITVLLIDDERDSRQVLAHYLSAYRNLQIIGEATDTVDAYEKITLLKPDLIFLDIQMPMGDGFSLLKKFDKINFAVIFVTSFDEYAINAIKFNALDYLLKPVVASDLSFSVNKAVSHIVEKRNLDERIQNLLLGINSEKKGKMIPIHVNDKVKLIDTENILYIEASGRYSIITLFDGTTHVLVKNLKDLELELEKFKNFIRISKSHLLNAYGIRDYSKGFNCFITMINLKTFEVSRRKKTEVLSQLKTCEKH